MWSNTRNVNEKARRIKVDKLRNEGIKLRLPRELNENPIDIEEKKQCEVEVMRRHWIDRGRHSNV